MAIAHRSLRSHWWVWTVEFKKKAADLFQLY
jgi:hypothetical protein